MHQLQRTAGLKIVLKLLPTLDILESAQKHLNDQGLAIAIGEFKNVLKEEGIEEINTSGIFDEAIHEALELVPGGKDGHIAEVVMPGYKFIDGLVIRHAKVKVYSSQEKKGQN
jgi:molecular chaperone GrpE (heat shock protein)